MTLCGFTANYRAPTRLGVMENEARSMMPRCGTNPPAFDDTTMLGRTILPLMKIEAAADQPVGLCVAESPFASLPVRSICRCPAPRWQMR